MSAPIHCLTALQRPVFLVNSRYSLFTATLKGCVREVHDLQGHPFFRSYGVNMPSSLARVISSASGYSPCPRVSVYSTVTTNSRLEVFLGSVESVTSIIRRITRSDPQLCRRIFLSTSTPTIRNGDVQHPDYLSYCVTPSLKRTHGGAGILTRFPSATPFGLTLGTD